MYYVIFHFHLLYVCTAWGQNLNPKHRINLVQNKAIQIISFTQYDAHTLPIFAKLNVIKFSDLISLYNCLFIDKYFISKAPSVFFTCFHFSIQHTWTKHSVCIACVASAIASWNFFQK